MSIGNTSNYGWQKPNDGDRASAGSPWGQKLRNFMDDVDSKIFSALKFLPFFSSSARDYSDKATDSICVFDFMDQTLIDDIRNNTGLIDATSAINDAVTYTAALGKRLYFPAGTYRIAAAPNSVPSGNPVTQSDIDANRIYSCDHDGIRLVSGTNIYGDGPKTRFVADKDCATILSTNIRVAVTDETLAPSNIRIQGIRFEQQAQTIYWEWTGMLRLDSAKDWKVIDCEFYQWMGDAIFLGGILASDRSAYLQSVLKNGEVAGCLFDGANNKQRNAISFLNGENVSVHDNIFRDCCYSTAPGAIDIEPEHLSAIARNISIYNNLFTGVKARSGIIALALTQATNNVRENIFIHDNSFIDNPSSYSAFYCVGQGQSTNVVPGSLTPRNIRFNNNTVTNTRVAFQVFGTRETAIDNNTFCNITSFLGRFGWQVPEPLYYNLYQLSFSNNIIRNVKQITEDPYSALLPISGTLIDCIFDNNQWIDCGNWSGSTGQYLSQPLMAFNSYATNSANLLFSNNIATSATNIKTSLTASFTTNVMTVSSVSSGVPAVGQLVTGASIPGNTYIQSIGTWNGTSGTFILSGTVGTIASESVTTAFTPVYGVTVPAIILQQGQVFTNASTFILDNNLFQEETTYTAPYSIYSRGYVKGTEGQINSPWTEDGSHVGTGFNGGRATDESTLPYLYPLGLTLSEWATLSANSNNAATVITLCADIKRNDGAVQIAFSQVSPQYMWKRTRNSGGTWNSWTAMTVGGYTGTKTFYTASSSGGAATTLNSLSIYNGVISTWT